MSWQDTLRECYLYILVSTFIVGVAIGLLIPTQNYWEYQALHASCTKGAHV